MSDKPVAAGKSSFGLVDSPKLIAALDIAPGTIFLDLACGAGAYSLALADRFGPSGTLHAVDLWKGGIEALKLEVHDRRIDTIFAEIADVSEHIPLDDGIVDLCLMATVLHDLIEDHTDAGTLRELKRVMKPGGRLAVVEFKKMDGPPGPPMDIRLSPPETENHLRPYAFELIKTYDIGPYNYLSIFTNRFDSKGFDAH